MLAGQEWPAAPRVPAARPWLGLAALAGALAVAALAALTLSRQPPPYGLELGIGVGFLVVVTLAVVQVEAAAFLGLGLLGIVVVDPAPADFVFLVVIAVTFATGRFRASAPPGALLALGGFLAAEPAVGRRGRRPPGRGSLPRRQHLPDDRRALAQRLRRLATTRADRRGGIPGRRRDVGCARRHRPARSRAGQGVPRRLRPRACALPGSERVRAIPRADRIDPARGPAEPASLPDACALEGVARRIARPRRRLLVLARRLAEPRRRHRRRARGPRTAPRRRTQRRPGRSAGRASSPRSLRTSSPRPARPTSSSSVPASRSTTRVGSPDRSSASSRPSGIRSGSARVSSRATRRSLPTARTCALSRNRVFRADPRSALCSSRPWPRPSATRSRAARRTGSARRRSSAPSAGILVNSVGDRHSALAAFLDRGRPDLGGLGATPAAQTSARGPSRWGDDHRVPRRDPRAPSATSPAKGGSSLLRY